MQVLGFSTGLTGCNLIVWAAQVGWEGGFELKKQLQIQPVAPVGYGPSNGIWAQPRGGLIKAQR